MRHSLLLFAAASALLVACGSNDTDNTNNANSSNTTNNTNSANSSNTTNNTNASNTTNPDVLEQSFAVSACGGFGATDEPTFGQTPSYCDAEVLDWSYDGAAGELKLSNNRVLLNCCGDHDIKVTMQSDGSLLVSETDAPEGGTGRCHCMCVFDFEVTVKIPKAKIPTDVIDVKLVREVTDDKEGQQQEIFSGQLDLATTGGSETIDTTDVDMWCDSGETPVEPEQVSHSPEVSDCGGFAQNSNASNALAYCDAEVLSWSYDAKAQQLKIADNRVELNCCGEHNITVTQANGAYTITEIDDPIDGARCNCDCIFDFLTVIDGVTGDAVAVSLLRRVSNAGAATEMIVFNGTLDLTAGSGSEILDANPTPFCNP